MSRVEPLCEVCRDTGLHPTVEELHGWRYLCPADCWIARVKRRETERATRRQER